MKNKGFYRFMNRFQNDIRRMPDGRRLPDDPDPIPDTPSRRALFYLTLFFCGFYPVLLFLPEGKYTLEILSAVTLAFAGFLIFSLITSLHSFRAVLFPVVFLGLSVLSDLGFSVFVPTVYALVVGSAYFLLLARYGKKLPLLLSAVVSYAAAYLFTGDFGLSLLSLAPYFCGLLMFLVGRREESRILVSAFGGLGLGLLFGGAFVLWLGLSRGFSSLLTLPTLVGQWETAFLSYEDSVLTEIFTVLEMGDNPALTAAVNDATVLLFGILPGLLGAVCGLISYGAHALFLRLEWYTGKVSTVELASRVEFFPPLTAAIVATLAVILTFACGTGTPVGNGALNLLIVFIPLFAYFGIGTLLSFVAAGRSCLGALVPVLMLILFLVYPGPILCLAAGCGLVATYFFRISAFRFGDGDDADDDGGNDDGE